MIDQILLQKLALKIKALVKKPNDNTTIVIVNEEEQLVFQEKEKTLDIIITKREVPPSALYNILGQEGGMQSQEEMVLCYEIEDNFPINTPLKASEKPLSLRRLAWLPRSIAEEAPGMPHFIPYAMVTNHKGEVLIYERNGTEKRLHGQKSIGWGGHVNVEDEHNPEKLQETILNALKRELYEELNINIDNTHITNMFMYYSNQSPVDRVHLCLASNIQLLKEEDEEIVKQAGKWISVENINIKELEHWSKILLNEHKKRVLIPNY